MIMPKDNRNKLSQTPIGVGNGQNPQPGQKNKLNKRSETARAGHNNSEESYGTIAEEEGRSQAIAQPKENAKQ
jgi:hypothetical protein